VGRFLINGELDPALAKRGIRRMPYATNSVRAIYVNMDDPVVGSMSNERVALRRAIALGIDVDTLIKVVYAGQGIAATQIAAPGISGYDAAAKPRVYDPMSAASLLDRFGYDKRDAQGFRLAPGGKPLALTLTIFTGTAWREIQTLLRKNMDALGVRLDFRVVPVQDLFKESAQGKFMLVIHGRSAGPNGLIFQTFYGPAPPEANESRFRYAPYDRALDEFFRAPTAPDRQRAARVMTDILQSYVPVMPLLVDVQNAFVQPWLLGYYPSPFAAYFQYLDIAGAGNR
jgi:ABC-type transport system substrate-binding protein